MTPRIAISRYDEKTEIYMYETDDKGEFVLSINDSLFLETFLLKLDSPTASCLDNIQTEVAESIEDKGLLMTLYLLYQGELSEDIVDLKQRKVN